MDFYLSQKHCLDGLSVDTKPRPQSPDLQPGQLWQRDEGRASPLHSEQTLHGESFWIFFLSSNVGKDWDQHTSFSEHSQDTYDVMAEYLCSPPNAYVEA